MQHVINSCNLKLWKFWRKTSEATLYQGLKRYSSPTASLSLKCYKYGLVKLIYDMQVNLVLKLFEHCARKPLNFLFSYLSAKSLWLASLWYYFYFFWFLVLVIEDFVLTYLCKIIVAILCDWENIGFKGFSQFIVVYLTVGYLVLIVGVCKTSCGGP